MFRFITKLFNRNYCHMCNRKMGRNYRKYIDDHGNPIKVCHLCVEYAERRAYRKSS